MSFIVKINTYYSDRGIEIHEEELISGKLPSGRPQYTAMVNIKVNTPEGPMPHPISAKFHAVGIEDAFKKAESEIKKEVEKFQKELNETVKQAKEDALGPRIITP